VTDIEKTYSVKLQAIFERQVEVVASDPQEAYAKAQKIGFHGPRSTEGYYPLVDDLEFVDYLEFPDIDVCVADLDEELEQIDGDTYLEQVAV